MRFHYRQFVPAVLVAPILLIASSRARAQTVEGSAAPSTLAPTTSVLVPAPGVSNNAPNASISALNTSNPASIAAQIEAGRPREARRRIPPIGVDLEVSTFLSAKTRSRFGASTFSIGPGIGNIAPSLRGKLSPDIAITTSNRTVNSFRNKLFIVSLGAQYRRVFIPPAILRQIKAARQRAIEGGGGAPGAGAPTGPPPGFSGPPPILPFYGASLSALYARVKVPGDGLNKSGIGAGTSVFAGVAFKNSAFVELRVRATTSVKSYNFSRAGITFGVRF